ncbi:MAG TPA: hypothetical protein VN697_09050, partial [Tepidiformaceae bacterium]|nr:hypothetical protein [Tepidiformaceae bacterium]
MPSVFRVVMSYKFVVVLGLAVLVLAALLQGCSGNSKPTPGRNGAKPANATADVAVPQLGYCPPPIGTATCNFAAQAEGWVQGADIDHLVGSGSSATAAQRDALRSAISGTFATPAATSAKLRSIACPLVADSPPAPDCSKEFALTFATISEKEITAGPGGILVLGFKEGTSGPQFSTSGAPEGPGRVYVMTGPNANGCELPGVESSGGCLGYRVFPVEVLGPGQAPPPAPGAAETINGIPVKPLEVGAETSVPEGIVIYRSPAAYASDSNPVALSRVYRDAAGGVRADDLLAPLRSSFGPFGITGWSGDQRMGELFVTTCAVGRCQAVGVGGWTGELDVYHSVDGGISWSADGHVAAPAFLVAVTSDGALMAEATGWDATQQRTEYRFFSFPSGAAVEPPAPNLMPRVVPGAGLVWEPAWQPSGLTGAEPTYDSSGKVMTSLQITPNLQAHLLGKEPDGTMYVGWDYVPQRAADPHLATHYIGRLDPAGKLTAIYSSGVLQSWVGPYPAGANQLIGNASLPTAATSDQPFDVPAVLVDMAGGKLMPLRELNQGLDNYQQPFVARVVEGPVVRVDGAGDCLNVREQPSTREKSLGCYRDGVLLGDRGESMSAGGIDWRSVSTPSGEAGWASREFLDMPPGGSGAAYPGGTRTGNPEIDPVLDAIASGDSARVGALVSFTPIACRIESGIGVEPYCPDGVAPGTPMNVFPVACAEGSSVPRADFDPSFLPGPDSPLYAIVRTVPFPMLSTEKGYALIYSTPYVWGAQLYIDGGRIVSFVSCG